MSEIYGHHPLQHGLVMLTLAGAVAYGGYRYMGEPQNWDVVTTKWSQLKASSFGLKDINLETGPADGASIEIGVMGSTCLQGSGFELQRVSQLEQNPLEFGVYVQKVGQQTLDAAHVELCIKQSTGMDTSVHVIKPVRP